MDDIEKKIEELERRLNQMEKRIDPVLTGMIPLNDNFRIKSGIGFVGKTADTTPGGAIIVNSPQGPIKILIV